MSEQLDLEEVTAILLEEHHSHYENSIPPKALHKILYFAAKEFEREHVEVQLPLYWYIYGAVVRTTGTGVSIIEKPVGQRIACETRVADITAGERTIQCVRRALARSLHKYYDLGLEGMTDEMYREAPYAVQRVYRKLDKQLGVAADDQQTTLFGHRNVERTRETVYEFVETFPVDAFAEYENDLHIWYRLVSAELDSEEYDPDRVQRVSELFWRLFCIELACRENNRVSRSAIASELNVQSVEALKQELRGELLNREREKARRNAQDTTEAVNAAEAFVLPHLDFDTTA
jgi:hypothetical protein